MLQVKLVSLGFFVNLKTEFDCTDNEIMETCEQKKISGNHKRNV